MFSLNDIFTLLNITIFVTLLSVHFKFTNYKCIFCITAIYMHALHDYLWNHMCRRVVLWSWLLYTQPQSMYRNRMIVGSYKITTNKRFIMTMIALEKWNLYFAIFNACFLIETVVTIHWYCGRYSKNAVFKIPSAFNRWMSNQFRFTKLFVLLIFNNT